MVIGYWLVASGSRLLCFADLELPFSLPVYSRTQKYESRSYLEVFSSLARAYACFEH